MLDIRKATANDAASLAILAERTFRDTYSSDNPAKQMDLHCADSFAPEIQLKEILDSKIITIIAVDSTAELVAFAQLRLESVTHCVKTVRPSELYRIYVSSEYHGHGLGRQIMNEVLNAAEQHNCDSLWLGVWEHNPRAVAFYHKFGFCVVGEHSFKLGQDPQRDLIMSVNIGGQ